MKRLVTLLVAVIGLAGAGMVAIILLTPWMDRWGATDEELPPHTPAMNSTGARLTRMAVDSMANAWRGFSTASQGRECCATPALCTILPCGIADQAGLAGSAHLLRSFGPRVFSVERNLT